MSSPRILTHDGLVDLIVTQGVTMRFSVTVNQPGTTTPLDLTGYTAVLATDRPLSQTGQPFVLDNGAVGGITLTPASGLITLVATPAQLALSPAGTEVGYSLIITAPSGGDTTLILKGSFRVEAL